MSQFSVQSTNSNPLNINPNEGIKNDDSRMSIDSETKNKINEHTSLDKMENLGGSKPPKPESTLHKVGRFLSGIIGGLLLAAGIAAATIASCGIAVGVAAAGIGLIAGATALRPKNPDALKNTDVQTSLPKTLSFDAKEADAILKAIKTIDGTFPDSIKMEEEKLPRFFNSIKYGNDGSIEEMDHGYITEFLTRLFKLNNINDVALNAKNVLVARHAIIQFFAYSSDFSPHLDKLNNAAWRKELCQQLNKEMKEYAPGGYDPDPKKLSLHAIFRAAISATDLENLSAEPEDVDEPEETTIRKTPDETNPAENKPEIKTVSMQVQGQEQPKTQVCFDRNEEDGLLREIKALDENFPNEIADANLEMIELVRNSRITKDDVQLSTDSVIAFTRTALVSNNFTTFELTSKNVLAVRLTLVRFLNDGAEYFPDGLNVFNAPDGQKKISDVITKAMAECEPGSDKHNLLAIFRAAVSETNLANLNTVKTVSMQEKPAAQEPPKEISLDAQGAADSLNALREIDGNATVVAAPMGLGSVLGDIERGNEGQFPQNVTFFVTNVLKQNRINYPTLTPKNVLLIRHSLAKYFGENPASHPEAVNILNSPAGRQKWAGVVKVAMQRENDEDTRNALAIFHAAITATDLSKLDTDENLLKENLNNSMLA